MASEWVKFSDLFAVAQKNGLTRPKRVRGAGLPMVNMGELFAYPRIEDVPMDLVPLSDAEHQFLLEPGDLLFARQSLVLSGAGQCSIFLGNTQPTVFESHIIRCRLDDGLADSKFYFYFFRSPAGRSVIEQIVEQGAGASGIRGSDLAMIKVPKLPLEKQHEISAVLSVLDDRIDNLRQTNATLEAIAQALFKSWFVDFDPVRAKAEGREPEGMDAATAGLFPSEFEDSELGQIPRGWTIGTVGDLMEIKGGKQLERTHFDEAGKNPIYGGAGEMGRTERYNAEGLVITVGRVGAYCGKFCWHLGRAWVNNNASRVTVPSEIGFWAYWCLRNADIEKIKKGAAQPFVSNSDIAKLPILVPSDGAMESFQCLALALHERMANLSRLIESFSDLRDTLLPRLISGRLRLPEAEAAVDRLLE